jgi:hypothetical protein
MMVLVKNYESTQTKRTFVGSDQRCEIENATQQ